MYVKDTQPRVGRCHWHLLFFIQIEVLCLNDVTNQQDNPRNNVVFIIEILCLNDVMNQQDKPRNNVVFIYLCY